MSTLWNKYPDIKRELDFIEEYILQNVSSKNMLLASISRELVESGGKRLRPALAILSARFGKYNRNKTAPVAGAIEILHTATLVHDDVIDRSELRRGRVTVSQKYGSDMAVYTGDFLMTKAVLMLSSSIPVDRLGMVATALKSICEGEVDQYQDKYNIHTSTMAYLKRISRKTAELFSAACGLGAFSSKCNTMLVKDLARFGFYYGMAFQIRDDIQDFTMDIQSSGKPVGKDIKEGIVNLPVIYAIQKDAHTKARLEEILQLREGITDAHARWVNEIVVEQGGLEYAASILRKYIDRGLRCLARLPDNKSKEILHELIEALDVHF